MSTMAEPTTPHEIWDQWLARAAKHDMDWFERILGDDVVIQEPLGSILDKHGYMDRVRAVSADLVYGSLSWSERTYGDISIGHGRYYAKATLEHADGRTEEVSYTSAYTLVCQKRDRGWVAISFAGTPVTQG